jgi:hypothetical protein
MTIFFATMFVLSVIVNILLVWYVRKLILNLKNGVKGIDDLQELLQEYCNSLVEISNLEQYYGDETITAAAKNTKMVIEACKFYKNSVLDTEQEEAIDKN